MKKSIFMTLAAVVVCCLAVALSINKEGVAENAHVDFVGNGDNSNFILDGTCWFLIEVVNLPNWVCDGH